MKQRLALLGSTGSIGRQTLEIVRSNSECFEISVLAANSSWQELARQAVEFEADSVVIVEEGCYPFLRDALAGQPIKVYAGQAALEQAVAGGNVDVVVNAIVG